MWRAVGKQDQEAALAEDGTDCHLENKEGLCVIAAGGWRRGTGEHRSLESQAPRALSASARPVPAPAQMGVAGGKASSLLVIEAWVNAYCLYILFEKWLFRMLGLCMVWCRLGIDSSRLKVIALHSREFFGCVDYIFLRFWSECLRARVVRGLFLRRQKLGPRQLSCHALHRFES